jgi:hypothetical protein
MSHVSMHVNDQGAWVLAVLLSPDSELDLQVLKSVVHVKSEGNDVNRAQYLVGHAGQWKRFAN